MIETIIPKDQAEWLALRTENINSTEVSALFGANQYLTLFELWHRKKYGKSVTVEENNFMKWGNRLQDSIAAGIASDNGFEIRKMPEYMRDTELRIGSSFDFAIGEEGILEIKNVSERSFEKNWIVEGEHIEAPLYIEAQVQHQLLISGRKYAYIGALVGGNSVTLIKREPDLTIHNRIREEAHKFWASIDNNEEPTPNFEKDAAFIRQLYSFSNPGTIKNIPGDEKATLLVKQYKDIGETIREMEKKKDSIKAALLVEMGEFEKLRGDGWSITAAMVSPAVVTYERKGYRGFSVNLKRTAP